MSEEIGPAGPPGGQVMSLRSGATLSLQTDAQGEMIVLRSAGGSVDLSIRMTDQGPVLSLRGVRLEIEATEELALRCREFSVEAQSGIRLASGGDVQVRSAGSTFVDGDFVNLNCLDRTGYHDQPPGEPRGDEPPPTLLS